MIVIASVVLGAVFIVSAVTKIAARQQWRAQAAGLGVPGLVSGGLPYAELGIGALLVAQFARRPVAIVAGVVLVAFTTLLVVRISQGRRPPCACFGGLSSKPISWTSVARNAVFIALAALVALG
ncbi:MAG TPA: MauE/DoxX family redox-associated membrane protein [Ilumatobacteraceae bacterium]|nr:MauE/DoxX family redox-associated membrane protein [Ilumatobacteraceae bacterium]